MKPLAPQVLETLARYDSPTICNVIELFDYRSRSAGFLSHRIRAVYPELPPMVGYAVTATLRTATPKTPEETSIALAEQVAACENIPTPRVMVIQDLDDPPMGAVYGEVMTSAYQGFGCVGLVTNGFGRDVLQVQPMKFPCFASGISVSHGYSRLLSVNEPVTIGGVVIWPGDLLHGDANGVTTIPIEIAERVAEACAPFVAAEEVAITAARSNPTSEKYAQAFAEFRRRRDDLARKLTGKDAGAHGV